MNRVDARELALWQRHGFDFELLDVRRAAAREREAVQIPGARWRDPARWLDWKESVPRENPVVVYCAQGHEISQGLAAALCAMGADARFLVDGFDGWRARGLPLSPTNAAHGEST